MVVSAVQRAQRPAAAARACARSRASLRSAGASGVFRAAYASRQRSAPLCWPTLHWFGMAKRVNYSKRELIDTTLGATRRQPAFAVTNGVASRPTRSTSAAHRQPAPGSPGPAARRPRDRGGAELFQFRWAAEWASVRGRRLDQLPVCVQRRPECPHVIPVAAHRLPHWRRSGQRRSCPSPMPFTPSGLDGVTVTVRWFSIIGSVSAHRGVVAQPAVTSWLVSAS